MSVETGIFGIGFIFGYFTAANLVMLISYLVLSNNNTKLKKFIKETKQADRFIEWKNKNKKTLRLKWV